MLKAIENVQMNVNLDKTNSVYLILWKDPHSKIRSVFQSCILPSHFWLDLNLTSSLHEKLILRHQFFAREWILLFHSMWCLCSSDSQWDTIHEFSVSILHKHHVEWNSKRLCLESDLCGFYIWSDRIWIYPDPIYTNPSVNESMCQVVDGPILNTFLQPLYVEIFSQIVICVHF